MIFFKLWIQRLSGRQSDRAGGNLSIVISCHLAANNDWHIQASRQQRSHWRRHGGWERGCWAGR